MNNEIFKDIPGYEGLYQVSDFGNVLSIKRNKILHPSIVDKRYLAVGLYKEGQQKKKKVHKLVTLSFIGLSKLNVNHINGIKTDNRLENLEYISQKENIKHAWKTGLTKVRKGSKSPYHKLTENNIPEIKLLRKNGLKLKEIANKYGVSESAISSVLSGKTWFHVKDGY